MSAWYGVSVIDEAIEGYVPDSDAAAGDGAARFVKPGNWREVLCFLGFWIVGVTVFFYCACVYGTGFVIPLFLTYCGFDDVSATSIMSIGTLSSIIFSLLGGFMSDRVFKSRRGETTMISLGLAVVMFLIMTFIGPNTSSGALTVVYFLAYGVMYICSGPIWCIPTEIVKPEFASQNMGTCLLFSGVGGFVMTNVFGAVIESVDARLGMFVLIGCMALVFIGAMVMNRKYRA